MVTGALQQEAETFASAFAFCFPKQAAKQTIRGIARDRAKRFRVKGRMGRKDRAKLKDALNHMKGARDHSETQQSVKTLIGKAHKLTKAVVNRHWGDVGQGVEGDPNPGVGKGQKGYTTKKDLVKLGGAIDHLKSAYKNDGMAPTAKTMCKAAESLVKEVHARHSERKAGASKLASQLLGSLLAGKAKKLSAPILEALSEALWSRQLRIAEEAIIAAYKRN